MNIETLRLSVRPLCLLDAKFILQLVNTEGWLKFIGDKKIYHEKEADSYIQRILNNPNYFYSVIQLKTTKEPVGIITFLYREDQKFPDLGFAILPEFEKNGYMLEASKSYLDIIKKHKNPKNIIALTIPENQKSIHLLIKLGFKYQNTQNLENGDLSVYSLQTDSKSIWNND